MLLPVVLLCEALFTLPTLAPYLTAPGCRPGFLPVLFVLSAVTPLLLGLRLLPAKKPVSSWYWIAVASGWVALFPVSVSCVTPS